MDNKKKKVFLAVALIVIACGIVLVKIRHRQAPEEVSKEVAPKIGAIRTVISTTGTVLPKNRLEIKPPVNGRVDKVLVQEGEKVKTGQILAWMSSTDRAALLDAARNRGEKVLQYWEDVYKPIALISPIDGEVIVATTQPGQTMTTNDAVVVLSDQLIVRAQVDETDIGQVILGQKAAVTLDAYPDTKIKASVDHIYYESTLVNNVTIYNVDLIPVEVPAFFRSGMNASVDFVVQDKKDILIIPVDAVYKNGTTYVLLKQPNGKEPMKARVELGISDDKNVEVVSGIDQSDRLIVKSKKYALPKSDVTGSNPFMPFRRRQ